MAALRLPAKFHWIFPVAARLFLGVIFAVSGYAKLTEPVENFSGLLAEYTILPPLLIPILARAVPWVEFLAGTLLILGFLPRWSAAALAFLSCNFLLVLALSKIFLGTLPAKCGCFGEGGIHLTVPQVMSLDFAVVALGFWLFSREDHPWSLDAFLRR